MKIKYFFLKINCNFSDFVLSFFINSYLYMYARFNAIMHGTINQIIIIMNKHSPLRILKMHSKLDLLIFQRSAVIPILIQSNRIQISINLWKVTMVEKVAATTMVSTRSDFFRNQKSKIQTNKKKKRKMTKKEEHKPIDFEEKKIS